MWEAKRANTKPNIKVTHETPSTAVVDGDGGFGLVVAPFAMKMAIEKAKKCRKRMGECTKFQSF